MEYVLDASVIFKWFQEEKLSLEALDYRRRHIEGKITIVVPALLFFEISNILATKPTIDINNAISALSILYDTNLQIVPLDKKRNNQILAMAKQYHLSAYDAAYLALAGQLSCVFITADEKLYEKIKHLDYVQLLK